MVMKMGNDERRRIIAFNTVGLKSLVTKDREIPQVEANSAGDIASTHHERISMSRTLPTTSRRVHLQSVVTAMIPACVPRRTLRCLLSRVRQLR